MVNFHEGTVELRRKRLRNRKRRNLSCCLTLLLSGMALIGGGGIAAAGPTGGQIVRGSGTIEVTGPRTVIHQNTQMLILHWDTFSTAPNEEVIFRQIASANPVAINYVLGGVPSVLEGALISNGRVYILNSAGITFTGTSHVNVGALLATTANSMTGAPLRSSSFAGRGPGQVINQGSIVISRGGFAILAAPYVENSGFIKADLGSIVLAGTNHFTVDFRQDGILHFEVPPDAVEKIKTDGSRIGVNNTGTLQAHSGQVLISASVATQIVNAAVNMSGVVDASGFAPNGKGGSVLITSEGNINLSGRVNASGTGSGDGGKIVLRAAQAVNTTGALETAAAGVGGDKAGKIKTTNHDHLPLDPHIGPRANVLEGRFWNDGRDRH